MQLTIKSTLFCVALLFSCITFSQVDTIGSFNTYYAKGVEKLRDLYATRGVSFLCVKGGNSFKEVSDLYQKYGKAGERLGIIFYSLDNDTLRIWLLKKGELYHNISRVTKEQLITAETDLRAALKVDLLLQSREAKNRGVVVKAKDTLKRGLLDEAIANATALLFPSNISRNLSGVKHLVVIPEFNISQFPLYILKPLNTSSYLIDSLSISIAPHLCNFDEQLNKYERQIGTPLAFKATKAVVVGNPAFGKSDSLNLSPLPAAEDEAKEIAAVFNAKPIVGKEATLSNVLEQLQGADLLYFATHGYADLQNGLAGSFLAFAPDVNHPSGLWNAKQIQQQKFTADASIAILSACQTGVGKIYDAGFIGIGRAFYKAGIDHTIMSLWSVDDAATKQLMTSFIKILTEEELYFYPAAHLRKAVLQYKKQDPDPAHWASFMLFGFPF